MMHAPLVRAERLPALLRRIHRRPLRTCSTGGGDHGSSHRRTPRSIWIRTHRVGRRVVRMFHKRRTAQLRVGLSVVPSASTRSSPTFHRPPTPYPETSTVPAAAVPAVDIKPGEPWIVYQAGTDHDTILLARDDGSDSHLVWGSDSSVSGLGQYHPDWSPDGATIAFTNEYFGAKDIWLVDAAGRIHGSCTTAPSRCHSSTFPHSRQRRGAGRGGVPPTWEPTVSVSRRSALILIDTASGRADEISVLEGTHTVYAYPRWSPDGDALVVSIGKFDETDTTWLGEAIAILRRTDTGWSKPKVITDFAAFGSYPDWSPAGDRIVFAANDPGWFINIVNNSGLSVDLTGITPDLFTVRPDGSRLKQSPTRPRTMPRPDNRRGRQMAASSSRIARVLTTIGQHSSMPTARACRSSMASRPTRGCALRRTDGADRR